MRPPDDQHKAGEAEQDVWQPLRQVRRDEGALRHRLRQVHAYVIDEDHPDAEREARRLGVLPGRDPQADADQGEDEAGDRHREPLVHLHDRPVRGLAARSHALHLQAQSRQGQLVQTGRGHALREHRLGAEADAGVPELVQLVRRRIVRVGPMTRSVAEHQVDRLPLAIDLDAAVLGHGDIEPIGLSRIGEEHVRPAGGGDLTDVEGQIVEAVVEDTRLDLAFRAARQHLQRQLPEPLVRLRHCDLYCIEGGSRRQEREERHRPQHAVDAQAAGLQGDRLPVGGHPAEPHQDADEQRHRNGEPHALRHEHQHQPGDRDAVDALCDELLGLVHEGRQHQHEGQDEQRKEEGRDDLAQDVAIRDPQHGADSRRAPARGPTRREGSLSR